MNGFLLASALLLAISAPAFADDVTIAFNPVTETYPPSYDTAQCELYGTPPCVVFSGTITDNDTDGSLLFLTGIDPTLSAYNEYFTVDNTFTDDGSIPGAYEGDLLGLTAPNTYSGIIMGLDIAPGTPIGTYTADAEFDGFGGTNDPNGSGFAIEVPFTVVIAPEPVTSGLAQAGLLAMAALSRRRRPRAC